MTETRATRIKRLRLRSMHRGIREMDLILGVFSARALETMSDGQLVLYEALLGEVDADLYDWVAGRSAPPENYADLIANIAQCIQNNSNYPI